MRHDKTLRLFHVGNHGLAVIGLVFGTTGQLWTSLLVYAVLVVLGMNVGLHRYFAHRSFRTHDIVAKLLALCAVIATVGSPLIWVAIHRQHHRHSDHSLDPHSPWHVGRIKTLLGQWNFSAVDFALSRDLMRDRFHMALHRHYAGIILAYCLVLAAFDPWLVIYAYAIPACMCFWAAGMINVWSHVSGYRNHATDDLSKNNILLSVITLGEGWHNTHHAHPARYKQGEKWWELDPPSWVIRLIKVA